MTEDTIIIVAFIFINSLILASGIEQIRKLLKNQSSASSPSSNHKATQDE